jgi:Na+-translocating ferredoxin:NAD+ oxidoreductase RNF subunit RnfB
MEKSTRSIKIIDDLCGGHMTCMRVCPTQAIRVKNKKAILLEDRCIDCGECVRVCPNSAIVALTSSFKDFSKFKYTVALPSPALYAQYGKNTTPATILHALTKIGFDYSYDVACASEAVSIAIQEYLNRHASPRPLLSAFCPAIVRLIQIRYPNLLDHIIPIESPMEIAAREVKNIKMKELSLKASEIGVIYITPCPAKMLSIKNPPRKKHSFIDGAIAIADIYNTLLQVLSQTNGTCPREDVRGLGLEWPIVGGQVGSLKEEDCLAVGGLTDVVRILEDIENEKLKDVQYIELHSCLTACVGGSLTVENPYIARGRILRMVSKYGSSPCQEREKIQALYQKNFFSLPGKIAPHPVEPLDKDIAIAIEKMQEKEDTYEKLPKIDCGVCGSPTCMSFAEDVVLGRASFEDCIFVTMKKFEQLSGTLLETVLKHSQKIEGDMEPEK